MNYGYFYSLRNGDDAFNQNSVYYINIGISLKFRIQY